MIRTHGQQQRPRFDLQSSPGSQADGRERRLGSAREAQLLVVVSAFPDRFRRRVSGIFFTLLKMRRQQMGSLKSAH